MIKRTADMVNEKKIEGISDIRDESDRDGVRIVYEDYRCNGVTQHESSKLFWIQWAVITQSNDPITEYSDPDSFDRFSQQLKSIFPIGERFRPIRIKV